MIPWDWTASCYVVADLLLEKWGKADGYGCQTRRMQTFKIFIFLHVQNIKDWGDASICHIIQHRSIKVTLLLIKNLFQAKWTVRCVCVCVCEFFFVFFVVAPENKLASDSVKVRMMMAGSCERTLKSIKVDGGRMGSFNTIALYRTRFIIPLGSGQIIGVLQVLECCN